MADRPIGHPPYAIWMIANSHGLWSGVAARRVFVSPAGSVAMLLKILGYAPYFPSKHRALGLGAARYLRIDLLAAGLA